ncbi:uncharacterized protein LOC129322469 [Prosopis cineraria]|uniref:uncharacterized protein LOC129322469 n=1 Tax=Prosopis cineraria TaxID=364024 RepID=UPI00241044E0|nr:uncharacterized protein LOC129322469 [Prosopis cineraria]
MLRNFSGDFPKGIRNIWTRAGTLREGTRNPNICGVCSEEPKDENLQRLAAKGCEIFPYGTLVAATNNFDPQTRRQDSFRDIYKGKLKDGREVAVEKLSETWQDGRDEFMREAEMLSGLHHPNVVKLFGCCVDCGEYILVYQYVPNSLHQLLSSPSGRKQLSWTQKYEIIEGIVNGLNYLHRDIIIIHGDMHPANILLDHQLKPIICGINRGRNLNTSFSTCVDPPPCGHLAPEYWQVGQRSTKSDVYSFGVLLLKLIGGKSLYPQNGMWLPLFGWTCKLDKESRGLEFLDSTVAESVVTEQVTNCIMIGLLCVQCAPDSRPRMDHVVSMLTGSRRLMGLKIDNSRSFTPSSCSSFDARSFQSDGVEELDGVKEVVDLRPELYPDLAICCPSKQIMEEDSPRNSVSVPVQDGRVVSEEQEDESLRQRIGAHNCQKFSYETLYDATNGFASQNVLGQGGFGLVYKGKLDDGREIAVKKSLNMSEQDKEALMREVELLSSVKHLNVVKLFGYCVDNNKFLLVYEYVPNKSLDKLLFGPNGREEELDWSRTYGIIMGIARGLSYLHGNPQNCIIHRDIKPHNILLDHKWVPKISDFGISRLFEEDQTHVYTRIVGTWGYIAPEYLDHTRVSVKTDVYSFGVLVLELISGKRYSFMPPPEVNAIGLLSWAYKLFKGGKISEIMDPTLANSAVIEQVKKCIEMGLLCTQGHPNSRPNMEHCVFMLTGYQCHSKTSISRPGVFGYRGYNSSHLSEATQIRRPMMILLECLWTGMKVSRLVQILVKEYYEPFSEDSNLKPFEEEEEEYEPQSEDSDSDLEEDPNVDLENVPKGPKGVHMLSGPKHESEGDENIQNENEDVEQPFTLLHLREMANMICELKEARHNLFDEQQVQAIMRSLSHSWEHMKVNLTYNENIVNFNDIAKYLDLEAEHLEA